MPICRSGSSATCTTWPANSATAAPIQQLKELLQKVDNDHATHGNYFYYLAIAPDFFGPVVRATVRRRPDDRRKPSVAAGDRRKAIRPRPGFRASAEPATAQGRGRKADLPHRPLPGQRNGPEHHGVPLRQRNLRTDLEPALHRSRPDFRGRKPSASSSAAATTIRPALCATWCPTTSCNSSASPPWSRRFRFRRTQCATSRPRSCTRCSL